MQYRKIFRSSVSIARRCVDRMLGKRYVHLLHIGKTGGTAIKHALRPYLRTGRYVIVLHPHEVKLTDIPERDHVVFFLRDPISRFISGFYSRQRQGQPRYFFPWNADEKDAFQCFDTPNTLAEALTSSDAELKDKAQKAMRAIRHVKDSYWNWFQDDQYFRARLEDVFFIGFQESLVADYALLHAKLGLPKEAQLPNEDTLSHRSPKTKDKSLSHIASDNLKNWYSQDYQFMELCKGLHRKISDLA